MSKYDIGKNTPIGVIKRRLKEARKELRIYVIANLVRVMIHRGCTDANITTKEKARLLGALASIRSGKKVLANWLPIGYQTARLASLSHQLSGKKVILTDRDRRRIQDAKRHYLSINDKHSRRQLRSLVWTCNTIGLKLNTTPRRKPNRSF